MYLLPNLTSWCAGRCLLSAAGVAEWIALLSRGEERRAEAWLRIVRWEPGLALWAAAGLRWRLAEPPTLEELARWLAASGTETLGEEHDGASEAGEGAGWPQWRVHAWVAGALATAEGAAPHGDRATAAALLQGAPRHEDSPEWLLANRFEGPLPRDLADAVALAVGGPVSLPEPRGVLWRRAWEQTRARWPESLRPENSPSIALGRLSSIVRRQRRLLERFHEELECEKLESLRQLAYGASHEINNPLGNIATGAQALLRDERDSERRRRLAAIAAQAFRAHEMVSDLMLFARPPRPTPREFDLVACAEQAVEALRERAEFQRTELRVDAWTRPVTMWADEDQLAEVVRALCLNALEAVRAGGRVVLRVSSADNSAILEVVDSGPGLSPTARRHLFDPYFSGREAGRGLGLGLSKCWSIVRQHQGTIEAVESSGGHLRVTMPLR